MEISIQYDGGEPTWIETNGPKITFSVKNGVAVYSDSGPKVTPRRAEKISQRIETNFNEIDEVKVYP